MSLKTIFILVALGLTPASANPTHSAICVPVASVHKQPKLGSEQVTQALLGDDVTVTGHKGAWTRIRVIDQPFKGQGYPGWVLTGDLASAGASGSYRLVQTARAGLVTKPKAGSKAVLQVFLGTRLGVAAAEPPVEGWTALSVPGRSAPLWAHDADLTDPVAQAPADPSRLIELARQLKGTHYLWGGMSERGIDCSGLTFTAYRVCGLSIPRDADQEYAAGQPVEKADMQTGDLMFFGSKPGLITHVGMYMGNGKFIQSSGHLHGVVITDVDDPFYVPLFQGARRFWHTVPLKGDKTP